MALQLKTLKNKYDLRGYLAFYLLDEPIKEKIKNAGYEFYYNPGGGDNLPFHPIIGSAFDMVLYALSKVNVDSPMLLDISGIAAKDLEAALDVILSQRPHGKDVIFLGGLDMRREDLLPLITEFSQTHAFTFPSGTLFLPKDE